MSKGNNRYDRTDHISRIQANLRQMKEEVTEYLRKSNNDSIPPVLRARHYLILSCINKLNKNPNENSKESIKVLKDLSSEKLGNAMDGERFEPLRECSIEKPQKNKIVKQKRTLLRLKNKSSLDEVDCLLPNICQIKLDFEDKTVKTPRRNMLEGKTIEINPQQYEYASIIKQRRFHSIDLNRQARIAQNSEARHSNDFKVTNRWLSASRSKELISTLHKKQSWQENSNQQQVPTKKEPIISSNQVSNQVVDLSKEKVNKDVYNDAQIQYLSPQLVYQQRKDAIIKRRAEAVMNFAKSKSRNISPIIKRQQDSTKKTFRFEIKLSNPKPHKDLLPKSCETKNQCSPWDESDAPERSLLTMEGQIF